MSRYDGLIIPRSYSEYLNKTDSATLSQMLQHLTGLWSHAVSEGDQKPVTSDAVNVALLNYQKRITCNITSSKNYEIPIDKFYSSWIIGGMAQGKGAFSEFLNLSMKDINKNYGYVKLEYSVSEKKITLSSTSGYGSLITLLYLNGV